MKWRSESNYPPGGWVYQLPGGSGVSYTADSLSALVRMVAAALGISAETSRELIEAQLCERHPHLCAGTKPRPKQRAGSTGSRNPLYRAASDWLVSIVRQVEAGTARVASDGAVFDRLAKCTACPHARKPDFGCSTCNGTFIAARKAILSSRPEAAHADSAPVCSLYGLDCLTAARFGLRPTRVPPPGCWATSENPDPASVDTTLEQQ